MKILVVGKGAIGGYFGGRLLESGQDVTFLVRRKSKELKVQSVHGNIHLPIKTIQSGDLDGPFDLVILSTKSYQLEQALADLQPFTNENTIILPLLNGIQHIEMIKQTYPHTLGGICFIESTLDLEGQVIQTSPRHDVVFGELDGELTERCQRILDVFSKANFKNVLSEDIQTAMWNKYVFIAGLSGITTLMYSAIGPILDSPYGKDLFHQLLEEITSIAQAEGFTVYPPEKNLKIAEAMGYKMKASMLRDMEKGTPIESDHLQGELLKLAEKHHLASPLLKVAYNRLKVYEMNQQ